MMCAWPSVIMRQPGNLTKLLKKQAKRSDPSGCGYRHDQDRI